MLTHLLVYDAEITEVMNVAVMTVMTVVDVMSVMIVEAVTDLLTVMTIVKETIEATEVSIDVVVAREEMIVVNMCPGTTVAVKMTAWHLKEINSSKP